MVTGRKSIESSSAPTTNTNPLSRTTRQRANNIQVHPSEQTASSTPVGSSSKASRRQPGTARAKNTANSLNTTDAAPLENEMKELQALLAQRDQELSTKESQLREREKELDDCNSELTARDEELANRDKEVAELEREVEEQVKLSDCLKEVMQREDINEAEGMASGTTKDNEALSVAQKCIEDLKRQVTELQSQQPADRGVTADSVPKPTGSFSIQQAMGLSGSTDKREQYLSIRRALKDIYGQAGLSWRVTWSEIPSSQKAKFFSVVRAHIPFMMRFHNDWATEAIVREYAGNKRAGERKRSIGSLPVPTKYAHLSGNSAQRKSKYGCPRKAAGRSRAEIERARREQEKRATIGDEDDAMPGQEGGGSGEDDDQEMDRDD